MCAIQTCLTWSVLLVFCLAFYTCLGLVTVGFYFVFKAMVIDYVANIPYRQGFTVPNAMIEKKDMTDIPKFIQFDRAITDNLNKDLYIPSKLDFPFLTHVPNRYGDDDEDDADHRSRKYKAQMDDFQRAYPYGEKTDGRFNLNCSDLNFAELRVEEKENVSKSVSFMRSACLFNSSEWFFDEERGDFCRWYNVAGAGGNDTYESPEDPTVVCFFVKLNNVVGFFPQPLSRPVIVQEIDKLKREVGDEAVVADADIFRHYKPIHDLVHVKILCWHDATEYRDLLSFSPGPYIHVKHFPFTGQKTYTQPATMMRLDFRKMPPIGENMVTINCRAMAANIPFDRKVDIVESRHYGHFKVTLQYDHKHRHDRKLHFKIMSSEDSRGQQSSDI